VPGCAVGVRQWPRRAGRNTRCCVDRQLIKHKMLCMALPCASLRAGLSCCASSLAKQPASLAPSGFNPRRQAGSNVYGLRPARSACLAGKATPSPVALCLPAPINPTTWLRQIVLRAAARPCAPSACHLPRRPGEAGTVWPRSAPQPTAPPGFFGQWAFAAYPRSQAPCGIPRPIDRAERHSRSGLPRPPGSVWHHQKGPAFALQVKSLKRPQAVALKSVYYRSSPHHPASL